MSIDAEASTISFEDDRLSPAEAIAAINEMTSAAVADPDNPESLKILESFQEALAQKNPLREAYLLSAIAELGAQEDTVVSEAAVTALIELSQEPYARLSAHATFELSKVLRQGSEQRARQAIEYLQPIVNDLDHSHWIDAVQGLAPGRSSRFLTVARDSVEALAAVIDRTESPVARVVYQAVCYQASEPNPEVAIRIEQIKQQYRTKVNEE